MRGCAKPTLVVIAAVALLVASISAQKGKPAPPPAPTYFWTATLPAADGPHNIFGSGPYVSGTSPAGIGSVRVSVTYYPPTRKAAGRTEFVLGLSGVVPGVTDGTRVGFKGIVGASTDGVPACGFPAFQDGVLTPSSPAVPSQDCIVEFLSGSTSPHKHPQWPYSDVIVKLVVPGVNLAAMAGGEIKVVKLGSLGVTIDGDSDDLDLLSGLYSMTGYQDGMITITRQRQLNSTEDTWVTDVSLPLLTYEVAKFRNPDGSIGITVPAVTTTGSVTTSVEWTRRVVQ